MSAPGSRTVSPDLLLARRAAAGQAAAWNDLVARYGRRFYNLAFQFAGDLAEAEDLTQEIFVKLFESLHRYRGDVPLAAWALRLSRNLMIDHYRASRRRGRGAHVSDEVLKHLPAGDDPYAEAQRRLRLRLVHEALDELPDELAAPVLLRDIEGLAYEEAAAALGVPLGTLKSRLNRARRRLADEISTRLEGRQSAGAATLEAAEPC